MLGKKVASLDALLDWDHKKLCGHCLPFGYGSIPINTIFNGMNIHKSQLFWCELQGYKVLIHSHFWSVLIDAFWNWGLRCLESLHWRIPSPEQRRSRLRLSKETLAFAPESRSWFWHIHTCSKVEFFMFNHLFVLMTSVLVLQCSLLAFQGAKLPAVWWF